MLWRYKLGGCLAYSLFRMMSSVQTPYRAGAGTAPQGVSDPQSRPRALPGWDLDLAFPRSQQSPGVLGPEGQVRYGPLLPEARSQSVSSSLCCSWFGQGCHELNMGKVGCAGEGAPLIPQHVSTSVTPAPNPTKRRPVMSLSNRSFPPAPPDAMHTIGLWNE